MLSSPTLFHPYHLKIMSKKKTTSQGIAKSPVVLQKEQELRVLEKKRKKINTNLKRNKTMLRNMKTQIKEIHQTLYSQISVKMEEAMQLQEEMKVVCEKVMASEKVAEEDKQEAKETLEFLTEDGIGTPFDMDEEEIRRRAEEANEQGGTSNIFQEFWVKPDEKEQKNIRKIYIKLAARFHPDKANSPKEADYFHQLMQKINDAYEQGDIAELLNIEQTHVDYESPDERLINDELLSIIEQRIEQIKNEILLLEGQLVRIKAEVKSLRNSEMGQLLSAYKRSKKYGGNLVQETIEEMEEQLDKMRLFKNEMEKFAETGEMSQAFMQKMMEEQINEMTGGMIRVNLSDVDLDAFDFGAEDEEYNEFEEDDYMDEIPPEALEELVELFGRLMEDQQQAQKKAKGRRRKKRN